MQLLKKIGGLEKYFWKNEFNNVHLHIIYNSIGFLLNFEISIYLYILVEAKDN